MLVTLDVTGGVGSPRHYKDTSSLLSPSHPHSQHNQHNVTSSQHYPNSQHSSMMYHGTGNTINTADVQANQYCYDRTLYQSGPGDTQDSRTVLATNNPAHQLGGKAWIYKQTISGKTNSKNGNSQLFIIHQPFFSSLSLCHFSILNSFLRCKNDARNSIHILKSYSRTRFCSTFGASLYLCIYVFFCVYNYKSSLYVKRRNSPDEECHRIIHHSLWLCLIVHYVLCTYFS